MIEEQAREKGRLREEVAYLQGIEHLGEDLCGELQYVMERLNFAIINYRQGVRDLNRTRVLLDE
jgi:hypothetical protein